MATFTPVARKDKRNKCGEVPIYLRIEASDRRQYISLRIRIKPAHWNPKKGEVRKGAPNRDILNRIIRDRVHEAKGAMYVLQEKKLPVTPAAIKELLHPPTPERHDFILFGESYAEELQKLGKVITSRRYFSTFRKLGRFTGGTLPFNSLSVGFFQRYRAHLVEHYGNSESTVAANFRAFKAVANRAIRDGILKRDDNPLERFSAREPRKAKPKLTLEEINAIASLELEEETIEWHTRNAFLFSFYAAGVRFRDVCLLKKENVRGGRLEYSMRKTGTPKSIHLVGQARAILALYKSRKSDFVFPFLDGYNLNSPANLDRAVQSRNTVVNAALKKIAAEVGITIPLTFHVSRHSFTDAAMKGGWDVYRISKALGHKEIRITEIYLRGGFDTDSIETELEELFGKT